MRIGLSSIYSYRPHVEHMFYVAKLLEQAGHEVFFLTCDSELSNCYTRSLKGTSKIKECTKCVMGGIRSYPVKNIQSLNKKFRLELSQLELNLISSSSASTLLRTECSEDLATLEYLDLRNSFYEPVEVVFGSASRWINECNLEGVICFNGRMEVTRAITYACEKLNIPYLTQERTWFSHGLQFTANANCLSLKDVNSLNKKFYDKYLTDLQARRAAKLIASRFIGKNSSEWRAYNLDSVNLSWPIEDACGPKILILPSSHNEFQGHPEWANDWPSSTYAIDNVLKRINAKNGNVLLRCHPNWGEYIGKNDGSKSEDYYKKWATDKNVYYIGSKEKANTFDLIQECDILIVNSSSAAYEAGACGKKIICLGHSSYEDAGFALHLIGEDEFDILKYFETHDSIETTKRALRFGYTMYRRFAQFVDYVEARSTTQYTYYDGADGNKLVQILKTGIVEADNDSFAVDPSEENKIIQMILEKKWDELFDFTEVNNRKEIDISRRLGLGWIDDFREKLPRGDR